MILAVATEHVLSFT